MRDTVEEFLSQARFKKFIISLKVKSKAKKEKKRVGVPNRIDLAYCKGWPVSDFLKFLFHFYVL